MTHQLYQQVQKWAAELWKGRKNFEDDPKFGHPAVATPKENINHVHHMVMDDK